MGESQSLERNCSCDKYDLVYEYNKNHKCHYKGYHKCICRLPSKRKCFSINHDCICNINRVISKKCKAVNHDKCGCFFGLCKKKEGFHDCIIGTGIGICKCVKCINNKELKNICENSRKNRLLCNCIECYKLHNNIQMIHNIDYIIRDN